MPLQLILNGQSRSFEQLAPGANLNDLVTALGIKADRVALEVNGAIAPRTSWNTTILAASDKIELVHFVGGGIDSEGNQLDGVGV